MATLRRAVVVGIDEYENNEKIPRLKGAVNDAREMCEGLRKFGGFEISDRHFLTAQNAKSEAIRRAICDLFWKIEPCELALFYFSGHGFQDSHGNGIIAPYDLQYDEPLVRGIRIQELRELFLGAKNKDRVLLVLDCCHSGIATDETKDVSDSRAPLYESLAALEHDIGAGGKGKFILASSGFDQSSREIYAEHAIRMERDEKHHHGLFTFHLLEGLNGEAADKDDRVTLGALQNYVSGKMDLYKGDHECTFWGFGSGVVDQVVIVNALKKREISQWLQQAEQNVAKGDAASLFAGIDLLKQAIQGSPQSAAAHHLKQEVDTKLQGQCRQPVSLWLIQNKRHYLLKFKEFPRLERLASNLCFEQIAKLEDKMECALLDLFRVAMENCEAAVLENDLQSLESGVQAPSVIPSFGIK